MSEDKVIRGKVDNGKRVSIDFPFYAGEAGVRDRGDYLEVAFVGKRPLRLPATGTLDGAPAEVVAARLGLSPSIVVLTVRAAS